MTDKRFHRITSTTALHCCFILSKMSMETIIYLLLVNQRRYIENNFFSQQDADHVAGDRARTLMSRMETRASSQLIFFIFVDYRKQRIISEYEDINVH